MTRSKLIDELRTLTGLDAPSGFEEPVLAYCRKAFADMGLAVQMDVRGNLYAEAADAPSNALTVAVMSHADEIGIQVTRIGAGGFLSFAKIGGISDSVLPGARVRLLTPGSTVEGTVGVRPGHILSPEEARRVPPIKEMYLDVGAASEEELASLGIEPGTPGVLVGPLVAASNHRRVFGKAIDNRAGVLAQLEIARHFAKSLPPCRLVYIVTVEEEVGLRGAEVAAKRIQPDVILALDTVPTGGTPELSAADLPWVIGKGPLIKVREVGGILTHRPLRERFRAVAHSHHIPIQTIVDTAGITDTASAQQCSGDVAALVLGIPRRYSHSAVEMLDLDDLENLIKLAIAGIPSLTDRHSLQRLGQ